MNKGLRELLDRAGAKPVDPAVMAEYDRGMREEVIPKIIEDMKEQRRLAHYARLGIDPPPRRKETTP